ncbi:DNA mismatch repair protein MutT [Roseobacter cerasinus]|uniref:DNA mismatch repair protein MutT n=1 Tax=Roseobacter cerasinus TaxID=2602289 RepID=A0A640VPY2_9RHOB|nr:NUDIX hydrolase [Roseobacter cerasinus]GFE50488.1 DNA mismatch repair protein MutT [Roseobacter cerasinus]
MFGYVKSHFEGAVRLWFSPARARQVAALCYRKTRMGKQVLLITSRGSGRWIVPKGWPIDGLSNCEAALQEAWEEAGVEAANVQPTPVGHYRYDKYHASGDITPVETEVYVAEVDGLAKSYPEDHQRKRRWFSPEDAAERVREPELKAILRGF